VRALLPSDERINGNWQLIIDDAGAGDVSAGVFNIEPAVDSWFD
jgi:hypothetical protein